VQRSPLDALVAGALQLASLLASCGALMERANSTPTFPPTQNPASPLTARFAMSRLSPNATPPTAPLSDVVPSHSPLVHGPLSASVSGLTTSARPMERSSSSLMERALSTSAVSFSATALMAESAVSRCKLSLAVPDPSLLHPRIRMFFSPISQLPSPVPSKSLSTTSITPESYTQEPQENVII